MDLKERVNVVQAKMNGAVAALTYGYFAHMNDAGGTIVNIGTDLKAVDSENINNSACSSEMLRGLVHAFTDTYKGKLALDETVCDPKFIPSNCIMKDKYGYMQRGTAAELSIDYPLTDSKKYDWTETSNGLTSREWVCVCYDNGKFVAVANSSSYFAYSIDGINWTETNSGLTSRYWQSVCYGNGKFVAVAYQSNYFAYSTDGINWTESTISDTSRYWYSLCYGNGKFVSVSSSKYFAYNKPSCNFNIADIFHFYDPGFTQISTHDTNISSNDSDIDGTFIINSVDDYKNKTKIGVILYDTNKNISEILNNIIKNRYIPNVLISDHNNYLKEQNYKYMYVFDSINNKNYFAITYDLLHYTTYDVTEFHEDYISFKNGIIFMYLPEKDAVAMITRHPHTTNVITIDGNDPENMTDVTKPYYRLIEIPFLKKYYKYTGKHVKNVKICVKPFIDNNKVYTDCALLINVFDRVYKIGIPNYTSDDDNVINDKRLQNFYTTASQTDIQIGERNAISSLLNITELNTEYINYSILNNYNIDIYTRNHLKITVDEMNYGYDHDANDTAVQTCNIVNNYTNTGHASYGDIPKKDYIYLPTAIYEFSDSSGGGGKPQ